MIAELCTVTGFIIIVSQKYGIIIILIVISTIVFNRNGCYYDAKRYLIAKFRILLWTKIVMYVAICLVLLTRHY